MRPLLLLLVAVLSAGCADLERLATPSLKMEVGLARPANTEGVVTLTVTGPGVHEVFSDAGLGLTTRMTIWPGEYTATLSTLQQGPIHFQGVLAFTNANGNVVVNNIITFRVRDVDKDRLRLAGSYRAITGSLRINATGLPFGVQARLAYRSPGGVEQEFNPAQPSALAPGSYELRFKPVIHEGHTYNPAPTTAVVTVEAGRFTTVNVTYSRGP